LTTLLALLLAAAAAAVAVARTSLLLIREKAGLKHIPTAAVVVVVGKRAKLIPLEEAGALQIILQLINIRGLRVIRVRLLVADCRVVA
jgi:hypothetical protein